MLQIVDYDLASKKFSSWPSRQLPPEWFGRKSAVRSISAHPQRPDALIFHDESSLWILEKNNEVNGVLIMLQNM